MKLIAFAILLLSACQAFAQDFWLRGPGACANSGDGKAYSCAASPGGTGAWVVDRNTNVNSGKWGDNANTAGAGDTLHICGYYDLPLTGADARDFIKLTTFTWDAANPIVLNLACPAGVTNGPTVADPAQADFAEDWRLRTWTDTGNNVWSTPQDGASMSVKYMACNDPDALGNEVDSTNRTGYGADPPSAFCEFDGNADSATKVLVYSEGNPSTYYTKLYASSKNFIQASNPRGLRIIGDTTTRNFELVQGKGYLKHMHYGVYLGTFSTAPTYTDMYVEGLYCESVGICIEHDGSALTTYYPRGFYLFRNGCRNIARGCITISGKFGYNTEIAYNWSKNSNRSYSTGAFYFGGGTDRTTHPNEEPKTMHHNFVDGVGWAKYWIYDGYGIYIEEGDKGVKAYANWVKNLSGNGQACFHSNSGFEGNSHSYSLCQDSFALAKSSDSAADGNVSVVFQNLVGLNITGDGLIVSGQAGDAAAFKNIILVAAKGNTTGYVAKNGSSLSPTFEAINATGFRVDDYLLGGSSSALAYETKHDPMFVGGSSPETPWLAMLSSGSKLRGIGVSSAGLKDFRGCGDITLSGPWDLGLFARCGRDMRAAPQIGPRP